jgi:hypothetical protein
MGWFKKVKKPKIEFWRRRRLCLFYDKKNQIVQEWIAVELETKYVICEIMAYQICYEVPRALVKLFMEENRLDDTELSCA